MKAKTQKRKENFTEYRQSDLQYIVRGSCFLGSGGGGGYQTGMNMMAKFSEKSDTEKYYKDSGYCVKTVQPNDPWLVGKTGVVVAYIGSPEKASKIVYPKAAVSAVTELMRRKGLTTDKIFIIPVEIGPISSGTACMAAARLGVPVLNGDPVGRAVPTLSLIAFATHGVSVNPTILSSEPDANERCEHVILEVTSDTSTSAASKIESLARPVISMPDFGQIAGLAMWAVRVTGVTAFQQMIVPGTLNICKRAGMVIAQEQSSVTPNIDNLCRFFYNDYGVSKMYLPYTLFTGYLESAYTKTSGGFDFGVIDVRMENDKERLVKMIFQNETLLVWDSNSEKPAAMAPDLISYLIEDNGKQLTFSNEDIMKDGSLLPALKGKKVHIIGLTAPKLLKATDVQVGDERMDLLCALMKNEKDAAENVLPKNYMAVINSMGYYGKNLPLRTYASKRKEG